MIQTQRGTQPHVTTPPTLTTVQLERATANALWEPLQANRWHRQSATRAISPTGNPRGHTYTPGIIPGPEPTIELIHHTWYVFAAAPSTRTRLGTGLAAHLTREQLTDALNHRTVSDHTAGAFEDTLRDGPPTPFHWDGPAGYRRNPLVAEPVAALIQRIARAATMTLLTDDEDELLINVEAEGDLISFNAVLAALQRGRA